MRFFTIFWVDLEFKSANVKLETETKTFSMLTAHF